MAIEAQGLLTDGFLHGLARGTHHSVAQLRTIFDSMKNQISRLEANNDKLRNRVKILLRNHAELERTIIELKLQQSSHTDDAKKEISQLQNQLERLRRESSTFSKQVEGHTRNLESTVAEKNKNLIDMKAENLRLKDQLEEQGLQFAQYQSRAGLTKDLIEEIRSVTSSVLKVQAANQSMIEKYSVQVLNAKQECMELKTTNEELELAVEAKNSIIESYERKIKDLEETTAAVLSADPGEAAFNSAIESSLASFRDHIAEMSLRSKLHIDELHKLASFASTELKRLPHRSSILGPPPSAEPGCTVLVDEAVERDTGQKTGEHYKEISLLPDGPDIDMNVKDVKLIQGVPATASGNGGDDIVLSNDGDRCDTVLNVTGLFPELDQTSSRPVSS